jgi:hypothetical protein
MPALTEGLSLQETPDWGISEYHVGYGLQLGAAALENLPALQTVRAGEVANASGEAPDFGKIGTGFDTPGFAAGAGPRLDMATARKRVKQEGLEKRLHLPDQPDIPEAQLAIMMRHAA